VRNSRRARPIFNSAPRNVVTNETSEPSFSIGVLSANTGCNVETIRYYERIGLLPAPARSAGGQRTYRAADADRLRFIQRARALAFPIEDVRKLIALGARPEAIRAETRALAAAHLAEIKRRHAKLAQVAAELGALIEQCPGRNAPACPIIDALQAGPTGSTLESDA
jgi:MerR family transcriptional regulator, mercuric resistance operon regulatory protein